ncbi:MAG: hypothetical protein FWC41_10165 [Firmicutes bacterium]|nr:hypothetical protein [Bacillota bacterium]
MEAYDIIVLRVYFLDLDKTESKPRPALIVKVTCDKIYYYRITTKYSNKSDFFKNKYFEIIDYNNAGLYLKSWIDTFALYQVKEDDFKIKLIGHLTDIDTERLQKFLEERNN